jgi:hypothetical protein
MVSTSRSSQATASIDTSALERRLRAPCRRRTRRARSPDACPSNTVAHPENPPATAAAECLPLQSCY